MRGKINGVRDEKERQRKGKRKTVANKKKATK